jgi:hypothetical protein
MIKSRHAVALLVAVLTALAAGCSAPDGPPATSRVGDAPPPATAPPATAPVAVADPAWTTGPITVTRQPAVPPVPVVTGIRYAGHPESGYDRLVLDIRGGLPGYTARYVTEVRQDGSDQPITVPGRKFLLLVLNPAQAHNDAGTATVRGVHTVKLPMLRGYAIAGDFEGHVSIALGLNATTGYRIGELSGRVYVDVKTTP